MQPWGGGPGGPIGYRGYGKRRVLTEVGPIGRRGGRLQPVAMNGEDGQDGLRYLCVPRISPGASAPRNKAAADPWSLGPPPPPTARKRGNNTSRGNELSGCASDREAKCQAASTGATGKRVALNTVPAAGECTASIVQNDGSSGTPARQYLGR